MVISISGSATGKPDSRGWIAELDYLPFSHGGPSFWPWLNARFAAPYVKYDEFNGGRANCDGSGGNASDNNTLFLLGWILFQGLQDDDPAIPIVQHLIPSPRARSRRDTRER